MRIKRTTRMVTRQDGLQRQRNEKYLGTSSLPSKGEKRYLAWGRVVEARSETMDVDVLMDTGITLRHVRVASREWAGSNAATGFGERDLPPVDAGVLIAFPDGTTDDAIILCSAFSLFGIHTSKWKEELLVASKERERLRVTENADKETYNKDTGAYSLEINGASINIDASGAVSIRAASGQSMTIDNNGTAIIEITSAGAVNIKPATGQSITLNSGAVGANDFPLCLFSTSAPHCLDPLQSVKVP